MRTLPRLLTLTLLTLAATPALAADGRGAVRTTLNFDNDWRFSGTASPNLNGTENPAFPDDSWRKLTLPHDWAIEGPIAQANLSGAAGAFLPGGIAFYRKTFTLPPNAAGKLAFLEFDGIVQNSTVTINAQDPVSHPSGFTSFRVPFKPNLSGPNVVAVKVDNSIQPYARWYAGAGINRHTRLVLLDPVHLAYHATFITTPKVSIDSATISIDTSIQNDSAAPASASLEVDILSPEGKSLKTLRVDPKPIDPGKSAPFSASITFPSPALWSFDTPTLYTARVRTLVNNQPTDEESTPFGIRSIEFVPATGFHLNGKPVKLNGVCLHEDAGGVGTAIPLGVWERRLKLLKSYGVNAVRTAHNAPAPEFLDLCDRLGIAVMHECFDCWSVKKVPGDYARFWNDHWEQDLSDTIKRDRNHPSIVIYSCGNEIKDAEEKQIDILKAQKAIYKQLDPTRPVTQALFRPAQSGAYDNGHADLLDVVGVNYRPDELAALAKRKPNVRVIGTEDNYRPSELQIPRDTPAIAGTFLWTGIDYLGEGKAWPAILQGFGMIDRTNQPRLRAFERQAWWTTTPMVKLGVVIPGGRGTNDIGGGRAMDWTPPNLNPHEETVEAMSNADEVELFLNDKSLGSQKKPATITRTWKVPFAPGTLKAVAKNKGEIVATDELKTAGKVTKLRLTLDQQKLSPAWDDVAYARVELVDDHGTVNPLASDKITFTLEGPGTILAVDNADLDSHEPFRASSRSAYEGTCLAILKATAPTGTLKLTASAPNLPTATATIEATP